MPVQQQEEAVVPCCSSQEASNKNAELLVHDSCCPLAQQAASIGDHNHYCAMPARKR